MVLIELGPVFRPVIQPCLIVQDIGASRVPGILKTGVLPVTERTKFVVSTSVATNAIALVQVCGSASSATRA